MIKRNPRGMRSFVYAKRAKITVMKQLLY